MNWREFPALSSGLKTESEDQAEIWRVSPGGSNGRVQVTKKNTRVKNRHHSHI
jgi:hypothetical protein